MITVALAIVALLHGPTQPAPAAADTIRVDIDGLRNDKGHVMCELFASADGFPAHGEKAESRVTAAITNGRATCTFAGADTGRFAVATFHDENDNGKLDTRIFGIPREGVGASKNATGRFGPPKFDAAAFHFGGGTLVLRITMKYL